MWEKAKLPIQLVAIALIILIAAWVLSPTNGASKTSHLFVPADAVIKNTESWDRMRAATVAPFTPQDKIWESVALTSTSSEVKLHLEIPRVETKAPYYPTTHYEGKWGETINVGSVSVQMPAIGVAWRSDNVNESPYGWFGPNFKTSCKIGKGEDGFQFSYHYSGYAYDNYPWAQLCLNFSDWKIMDCSDLELFDARTHKSLLNGYSSSKNKKGLYAQIHPQTWHSSPVDVVLHIGTADNAKTVEFEPTIGAGFRDGNMDFRLASIQDNASPASRGLGGKRHRPDSRDSASSISGQYHLVFHVATAGLAFSDAYLSE